MNASGDENPTTSGGWESFLNSNPIVVLSGVAVSVATVVAGVMTYVSAQKFDALDIQHKTEITELKNDAKAGLEEATQPLKDKLADLSFRVSSIERRLPGSGPSYLDVSSITIGPEARNSLDARYTSFDSDGFLVAIPKDNSWKFRLTDELEYNESMYLFMKDLVASVPQLQVMSKAVMYQWRNDNASVEIHTNSAKTGGLQEDFIFYPSISVEHFDVNLFKDRFTMLSDIVNNVDLDKLGSQANPSHVGETIDATLKDKSENNQKDSVEKISLDGDKTISKSIEDSKQAVNDATTKEEILKSLDKLGTSDLANLEFEDQIGSVMMQNSSLPLHIKILSAQKKGNVFYAQEQVGFKDVDVKVNGGPSSRVSELEVDKEVFCFSRGADAYLVQVILPPVPTRAENFTWSKSWLTGLQIPVN